jgi:hypothetical protein
MINVVSNDVNVLIGCDFSFFLCDPLYSLVTVFLFSLLLEFWPDFALK